MGIDRQTFPSVSFHRCRCVSVKCVERVLSVLEARVNVCRGESLVGSKYSLLLSVRVDPSAEHIYRSIYTERDIDLRGWRV